MSDLGRKLGELGEKRRKLSPRQKIAAKELASGKTQHQALLAAGYSETVARHPSTKTGKALREYFAALMPSEEEIAATLRAGLEAKRTEFVQWREGRKTETKPIDLIDYSERRQYARLCANYRGIPETERLTVGPTEELVELKMLEIGGENGSATT